MKSWLLLLVVGVSAAYSEDIPLVDGSTLKSAKITEVHENLFTIETDSGVVKIQRTQIALEYRDKHDLLTKPEKELKWRKEHPAEAKAKDDEESASKERARKMQEEVRNEQDEAAAKRAKEHQEDLAIRTKEKELGLSIANLQIVQVVDNGMLVSGWYIDPVTEDRYSIKLGFLSGHVENAAEGDHFNAAIQSDGTYTYTGVLNAKHTVHRYKLLKVIPKDK